MIQTTELKLPSAATTTITSNLSHTSLAPVDITQDNGVSQNNSQTSAHTTVTSEVIQIQPADHSPTTQQLESWMISVSSAQKQAATQTAPATTESMFQEFSPSAPSPTPMHLPHQNEEAGIVAVAQQQADNTEPPQPEIDQATDQVTKFKELVTSPLSAFLLQTPKHKQIKKKDGKQKKNSKGVQ